MGLWSHWFGHPEKEREMRLAAERVERIRAQVQEQLDRTREQLERRARVEREKEGWNGGVGHVG